MKLFKIHERMGALVKLEKGSTLKLMMNNKDYKRK